MRMSDEDKRLYKRVDEVLHYIWDPIGVADEPFARSEYQSYVPKVFRMVRSKEESQSISKHLAKIVSKSMALSPNIENCNKVAGILLEYRRKIFDESP